MAGCEKTEVVQTVEWYKEHKAEREAVLKKCNDNPGKLMLTPNCVNAHAAAQAVTWGVTTKPYQAKPMTAEELGFGKINTKGNETCLRLRFRIRWFSNLLAI